MAGLRTDLQVQMSCGQVLVPKSRQSRHNIRRERVVPKNVRSFTTQFVQIETTCSAPDPSFRTRGHEYRCDGILGLRLGWWQRSADVVKCGRSHLWDDTFESVHKKTEDRRQ